MAGIYIHIPFCKQACHYCNFHFSASTKLLDPMVKAICKEIELQQSFFEEPNLTIDITSSEIPLKIMDLKFLI